MFKIPSITNLDEYFNADESTNFDIFDPEEIEKNVDSRGT